MLEPTTRRVLLEHIVQAAEAVTGMTKTKLRSDDKTRPLVRIRHASMILAAYYTEHSIAGIGRYFNRDHTTVLWALGRGSYQKKLHPATRVYVSRIDEKLQEWQEKGHLYYECGSPPISRFECVPPIGVSGVDLSSLGAGHA